MDMFFYPGGKDWIIVIGRFASEPLASQDLWGSTAPWLRSPQCPQCPQCPLFAGARSEANSRTPRDFSCLSRIELDESSQTRWFDRRQRSQNTSKYYTYHIYYFRIGDRIVITIFYIYIYIYIIIYLYPKSCWCLVAVKVRKNRPSRRGFASFLSCGKMPHL